MVEAIGVDSIDDLFRRHPESLRLQQPLIWGRACRSRRCSKSSGRWRSANVSTDDEVSFLGAGMYDHYIPALIDSIILRSEFLTPYTPYQPEISQGGLQAMFEYQTAISELTACPVSMPPCTRGQRCGGRRLPSRSWRTDASGSSSPAACIPHSRESLRTLAKRGGSRSSRRR